MDILIDPLFPEQTNSAIPGYFVRSTALLNVEDLQDPQQLVDTERPTTQEIVEQLYQNHLTQKGAGVVIAIHGYNTGSASGNQEKVWQGWYQPLCNYANVDRFINQPGDRFVFLGYRWPSESLKQKHIWGAALRSLPVILKFLLVGGFILAIVSIIALILSPAWFWNVLLALGIFGFSLIFCLYILRVSVYFRDTYRATYFGVNDLVELIRQLDQGLVQRKLDELLTEQTLYAQLMHKMPELQRIEPTLLSTATQRIRQELSRRSDLILDLENKTFQVFLQRLQRYPEVSTIIEAQFLPDLIQQLDAIERQFRQQSHDYWKRQPLQLSFIGHSMGAHVTTQTIRILSDVFDPRSIGTIGTDQSEKLPSSRVGHVFCLARLVLVSPDIPLLAITSGRSNFLRSSLRRFDEAYLFSNEGDLALRIASTAANYFSFPARTRTQGYRLGNVTVRAKRKAAQIGNAFGIVNLDTIDNIPAAHLLPYLEVNVLNQSRSQNLDPTVQRNMRRELKEETVTANDVDIDKQALADLFTYFDCTEYRDYSDRDDKSRNTLHNIMILDGQRSPLKLFGYIRLFIAYASGSRDVHGGYFGGKFSQLLLYRLVFLGFAGLLDSLVQTSPEELGLQALPEDLRTELDQARNLTAPISDEKKRRAALKYLSWLCQQKRIQAAVSPERYQVDVLKRDQDNVRETMMLREKQIAPNFGDR